MRVVVLYPHTKFEVWHSEDMAHDICVSIDGSGDPDLCPLNLEIGTRFASKVRNLTSKFGHARPLDSRIIRHARDGRTGDRRTDGRTKATLTAPSLWAGHNKTAVQCIYQCHSRFLMLDYKGAIT